MSEEFENYASMQDEAAGIVDGWEQEQNGSAHALHEAEQRISGRLDETLHRLDQVQTRLTDIETRLDHMVAEKSGSRPVRRSVPVHATPENKDALDIQAAWGMSAPSTPRWPATLAIIVCILLYVTLPNKYLLLNNRWLVPVLEGGLLIALGLTSTQRGAHQSPGRRWAAIALIAVANAANEISLFLLIGELINGNAHQSGKGLFLSAAQIWLTSVIIFGLWFWELDRGGPVERCQPKHREPDFLFPQMSTPESAEVHWTPSFADYLYVSLTNAMAFSPTDTMPLTEWAKALMGVQAITSLLTIGLVGARAVNILS